MLIDNIRRNAGDVVCVNGIERVVIEVKELNLSLRHAKGKLNIVIGNRTLNIPRKLDEFLKQVNEQSIKTFTVRYMRTGYYDNNIFKNHFFITRLSDEPSFDSYFV